MDITLYRQIAWRIEERMDVPRAKLGPNTELAHRLKQVREERSMSVADFAKLIDVTPAAIWHWENRGTRPRSGTVDAIAQRLGITRSFLETGKPTNSEKRSNEGSRASEGSVGSKPIASEFSLEELMRAIEAKGFDVYVKSRND
jgi:transcriptional regulator with XRE-family HTH domain